MAAEAGIISHVMADSGVVAAVGSRVSPQLRRQGDATPAIVYEVVDVTTYDTLAAKGTLARMTIRFDCVADGYGTSRGVADTLRTCLDGASFDNVQRIFVQQETSSAAIPDDGQGDAERITTLTAVAWIQE